MNQILKTEDSPAPLLEFIEFKEHHNVNLRATLIDTLSDMSDVRVNIDHLEVKVQNTKAITYFYLDVEFMLRNNKMNVKLMKEYKDLKRLHNFIQTNFYED